MSHSLKYTSVLLIDGENIALEKVKAIVDLCSRHTNLTIKNAYGDWNNLSLTKRDRLSQMGITLVQQDHVSKNAADFRLSIEAGGLLEVNVTDIYFIVSHDGGYSALCQQIREKGCSAIIIRTKDKDQVAPALLNVCDGVYDLDTLINNPAMSFTMPSAPPKAIVAQKEAAEAQKEAQIATDNATKAREVARQAADQLIVAREDEQKAKRNAAEAQRIAQQALEQVSAAQEWARTTSDDATAAEQAARQAKERAADAQRTASKFQNAPQPKTPKSDSAS